MPLTSLAELMRQVLASILFRLARQLESLARVSEGRDVPIEPAAAAAFVEMLESLRGELVDLGLSMSVAQSDRVVKKYLQPDNLHNLSIISSAVNQLADRIQDELTSTLVFAIPRDRVHYYIESEPFGPDVAKRFKGVSDDTEEAARCIAVGRGTASVFHLMRVLEAGLQHLGKDIGVTMPDDKNWQVILNEATKAVKGLPHSTASEKDHLAKRSAALSHLQHVKDAWRNDVMHPGKKYTVEEAEEIFVHTKALMRSLAAFL